MNTTGKIAFGTIAAISLVVASVAMAHNHGDGHGHGMMGDGMKCDPGARAAERLTTVKEQLNLTAAQTDAWQAFETAVRNQAESMPKRHREHDAMSHNDMSHNMEEHIAFMEQRLTGMKTILKARNELYSVLTPEQKATADKLLQHNSHFGWHR